MYVIIHYPRKQEDWWLVNDTLYFDKDYAEKERLQFVKTRGYYQAKVMLLVEPEKFESLKHGIVDLNNDYGDSVRNE